MDQMTLSAVPDSLEKLNVFCVSQAAALGCDEMMMPRIELVFEELAVNVISHAYGGGSGNITVGCGVEQGAFVLEIQDSGEPFDPLEADPPDVDAGIEDRPIGGLGIHLVRDMTSRLVYARKDDKNIIRAFFDLER